MVETKKLQPYPDEILRDLAKNVRRGDSEKILLEIQKAATDKRVLSSDGLDQAQIIRRTGLTIAVTTRTLEGLKGAGFIRPNRQQYGRSTYYVLTDNGKRLIELFIADSEKRG